jgi:hypothetical protein
MVFQLCSKKALLYAHSFSDGLPAQPAYYSVHFAATPRKAFRINTLYRFKVAGGAPELLLLQPKPPDFDILLDI